MIVPLLRRFENDLVERISQKAVRRLLAPGRWSTVGPAPLICEVMTGKEVRKGNLGTQGRLDRETQIARAIDRCGKVEFAILLLPFRTISPLKNRSTLPDMGEFYTLTLLHALARACHEAQRKMQEQLSTITKRLGEGGQTCVEMVQTEKRATKEIGLLFDQAIAKCEALNCSPEARLAARKRLRQMKSACPPLRVHNPGIFVNFLVELTIAAVPLNVWLGFQGAAAVPVQILACQDSGRYPCFKTMKTKQITDYRSVLLDAFHALGLNAERLRLVDYTEVKAKVEGRADYQEANCYFERRRDDFAAAIEGRLADIWGSAGCAAVYAEFTRIDPDGVLASLFEPILFSLEHSEITEFAHRANLDPNQFYLETMQRIYEPCEAVDREQLRRLLIANALRGAALYSAAYEANIGSKNLVGFDDVTIVFPNALCMSIHRKNETWDIFPFGSAPPGIGPHGMKQLSCVHRMATLSRLGLN